jgi:hypothetical protein
MTTRMMTSTVTGLTAAAALFAAAGQASAQAAPEVQSLIAWKTAPLAQFTADERDAGLARALAMLPERLAELPEETRGEVDAEAIDMFLAGLGILSGSSKFAIVFNPTSTAGGAFGYGIIAGAMLDDVRQGQPVMRKIDDVIREQGERPPRRSTIYVGMRDVRSPGGRLYYGPREGPNGPSFDLFFGTVDDPDAPFAAIPEPTIAGLRPVVHGSFDFRALTPLATMGQFAAGQAMAQQGEQVANVARQLSMAGLIGDNAMRGTFELGYTQDAMRFRVNVDKAAAALDLMGIGQGALTPADLAIVPADATMASVSLFSLQTTEKSLNDLREQQFEVDEFLANFEEHTGVNLVTDVLGALGGVSTYYTADATGGGGLMSMVAAMTFTDRAKFITAHDRLRVTFDNLRDDHMEEWGKYVGLRSWRAEGVPAFSVVFTGLPVPLEISYAFTDRHIIGALTPQSLVAAVRQATGKGDSGLGSRNDLRGPAVAQERVISLNFVDTPRAMRSGYGLVSLVGSAIANAVRTPGGDGREPGMIVPPYAELASGVRPAISVTYRSGEEGLVLDSYSDRSILAGACGAAGTASGFAPIALLGFGAFAVMERNGMNFGAALPAEARTLAAIPAGARSGADAFMRLSEGPLASLSAGRLAALVAQAALVEQKE